MLILFEPSLTQQHVNLGHFHQDIFGTLEPGIGNVGDFMGWPSN